MYFITSLLGNTHQERRLAKERTGWGKKGKNYMIHVCTSVQAHAKISNHSKRRESLLGEKVEKGRENR